jgi:uncharacterized membrane protein (DUF441 family)
LKKHVFILVIFMLGLLVGSKAITLAAGFLLIMVIFRLNKVLPLLKAYGLKVGLIFLMLTVLVPVARDRVKVGEIISTFNSMPGLLAIAGGITATLLNSMGLTLLEEQPQIILGLVCGSLVGIVFFKGVPVGPLTAGGIAALFLYFSKRLK